MFKLTTTTKKTNKGQHLNKLNKKKPKGNISGK